MKVQKAKKFSKASKNDVFVPPKAAEREELWNR